LQDAEAAQRGDEHTQTPVPLRPSSHAPPFGLLLHEAVHASHGAP
jgi:hypothetical protein